VIIVVKLNDFGEFIGQNNVFWVILAIPPSLSPIQYPDHIPHPRAQLAQIPKQTNLPTFKAANISWSTVFAKM
jgi:hypothetical protein